MAHKVFNSDGLRLTLKELIEGARHDPGFQNRLRVMDIDENLGCFFWIFRVAS